MYQLDYLQTDPVDFNETKERESSAGDRVWIDSEMLVSRHCTNMKPRKKEVGRWEKIVNRDITSLGV